MLIFSLLTLLVFSVPFWLFPLDRLVSSAFYTPGEGWPLKDHTVFRWAYDWGIYLGVGLGVAAAIMWPLSYVLRRWVAYRKVALLMLWTLLLGPGLLVNSVFKKNWGRPRPRETVHFGGAHPHFRLWEPAFAYHGHSFPSGHASMGAVLITPALFFALRRRKRITAVWIAIGLLGWIWLGSARLVAGGHFLSDVLWAGGMVWLVALAGARVIRPDRDPPPLQLSPDGMRRRKRLAALGLALALLVINATPYISQKQKEVTSEDWTSPSIRSVHFHPENAHLRLDWSQKDTLVIRSDVLAFGLPVSKLMRQWRPAADSALYRVYERGFFHHVGHDLSLKMDPGILHYRMVLGDEAELIIEDWPTGWKGVLEVVVQEGDLTLQLPEALPQLEYHGQAPWPQEIPYAKLAKPDRSGRLILRTPQGGLKSLNAP